MIVVDSSIALQWVLPESGADAAEALIGRPELVAPDLILIEVANVLAKKVRAGDMTLDQAQEGLMLVRDTVGRLNSSVDLCGRALDLSVELSHPVYDCCFLACALAEDASLATRDQPFIDRLARAGYGARVYAAAGGSA